MHKIHFTAKENLPKGLVAFGLLCVLYLVSQTNYLLFHSLAEIFSIVVAGVVFVVYWNTRDMLENNFLVFISVAFLFIGLLDLIHTLAYKGMGVFPTHDANLPTQLWIAARYLESVSMVVATFFLKRKLKLNRLIFGYVVVFVILIAAIFIGIFPDCYIEGIGLTPFKVISEYLISLLLVVTLVRLYQNKSDFEPVIVNLMFAALVTTILAELAFTFYISVYGFSNFVGHILKIFSFYLIYLALIRTGLDKPYTVIFRELKQREEDLQISETRYRELFENIPDGVAVFDSNRICIRANQAMIELVGCEDEDDFFAHFRNPFDLLPKTEHEKLSQGFKNTFEKGSYHDQYQLMKKDGGWINIDITSRLTKDQAGKPVSIVTVKDITEYKQAEEERQRLHEQVIQDANELEKRVQERTEELEYKKDQLQILVDSMVGREVRMAGLKKAIKKLREQLDEAGLEPVANDPLLEGLDKDDYF